MFDKIISLSYIMLLLLFVENVFSQDSADFICNDGRVVKINKICDGKEDCSDGEDETEHLCHHILCPLGKFRCHYGACVDSKLQCDGIKHCADKSDEEQCGRKSQSCNATEYMCFSGGCISVEKLCNGSPDCKDGSDEGKICKKVAVCPPFTHRCNVGSCIYLNQRCDGHRDCVDGSDESEILCASLKCTGLKCHNKIDKKQFCAPVTSHRINVYCEIPSGSNRGVIACDRPVPPGTVVRYECKPYYLPASHKHRNNKKMICQSDGTWNRDMLRCLPDCGISKPDVAPLIVNGWFTEKGNFPWHAVLFTLEEGKWIFTCGGTLITEKIVFTAAHCAWNIDNGVLQIALGKYYSDYYAKEDYVVQFKNISKIIIQPAYQGVTGNYGSDIAILVLSKPVEFSEMVRPACIDWNLNDITEHLAHQNLGLIAGMGITENNTISTELKATYLPVVSNEECLTHQKSDFKKYLTFTSFCAGWKNGSAVCNGDSGGGLVFPSMTNSKKYSLQGIVSVSPRRLGTSFCDPDYYTVFTKVGMYVQWIHDVLLTIHDTIKYESDIVF